MTSFGYHGDVSFSLFADYDTLNKSGDTPENKVKTIKESDKPQAADCKDDIDNLKNGKYEYSYKIAFFGVFYIIKDQYDSKKTKTMISICSDIIMLCVSADEPKEIKKKEAFFKALF